MASSFGGPGVARLSNVVQRPTDGAITVSGLPDPVLITSVTLNQSERVQEILTLAEAAHVYTFGKNLPRVNIQGWTFVDGMSDFGGSEELNSNWMDQLRAKKAGESGSPNVQATIQGIGTFNGIGIDLQVLRDVGNETVARFSLTILVIETS